jgi:hypothetical protein
MILLSSTGRRCFFQILSCSSTVFASQSLLTWPETPARKNATWARRNAQPEYPLK